MYTIKKEFYGCMVNLGFETVVLNDEATQEQLKRVYEAARYDTYVSYKATTAAADKPETPTKP